MINKIISNILIVDDDRHNILFLEEMLSDLENIKIFTANTGYEAIETAKNEEMALILLDLMMPGIDGFQVIKELNKSELNKSTPVIIISGAYTENEELPVESVLNGAIDFLAKPINSALLMGKVKQFINLHLQRRHLHFLVKELEKSNTKLLDSHNMLQNITSVANEAIIVINHEGYITFLNKSAKELFVISEVRGNKIHFTYLLSGDERNIEFVEYVNSVLNENTPQGRSVNNEIEATRNGNINFPADFSVSSFKYQGRLNMVLMVRDISERIKNRENILKTKELKEANKIMREFMSNVSHELRTPMNAIIGISKMILKYNSNNLTEKQKEGLELIENSGDRLLELINDILDLSRIESKRIQVINESYSFNKLISSIKNTVIGLIDTKEIKFVVRKSSAIPEYVLGDYRKLTQILLNILGNSIKFTNSGKIELSIHVTDGKLFFEVRDTGIGISEENLKIVFDKFRRIESAATKKYKGTGLGLAITKGLIELLGGNIEAFSKEGEGTTMIFYIPFVPDEEKNKSHAEKHVKSKKTATTDHCECILLIEDNEELIFLIENILKVHQFNLITFSDALTALNNVEDIKPQLIIVDFEISNYSAYDIIKRLNKEYQGKYPILLLANDNDISTKGKYKFDETVSKPVSEMELINSINRILNNYNLKK